MTEPALVVAVAALGAVIGSFLNACIYRMPRGISLNAPRRSFCPLCNKLIPWYENIPILSWLWLRGRCSGCGGAISWRYPLVEALTSALFVWVWLRWGWPVGLVFWIFVSLLVAATFIDFEHLIIPDELTIGGLGVGVVLAMVVPPMHEVSSPWEALGAAAVGAATGFGALWAVVELGKLAFGKKAHRFAEPVEFVWRRDGERADLEVGGEVLRWEEVFSRVSDQLVLECVEAQADGKEQGAGRAIFHYDRVSFAGAPAIALDHLAEIRGRLTALVIPREAMGFGDVKFLAAIGAFVGWKGVVFTLFAASILGCAAGLAGLFLARDKAGARLPFGPFLAAAALWWILGGRQLAEWYFGLFRSGW